MTAQISILVGSLRRASYARKIALKAAKNLLLGDSTLRDLCHLALGSS